MNRRSPGGGRREVKSWDRPGPVACLGEAKGRRARRVLLHRPSPRGPPPRPRRLRRPLLEKIPAGGFPLLLRSFGSPGSVPPPPRRSAMAASGEDPLDFRCTRRGPPRWRCRPPSVLGSSRVAMRAPIFSPKLRHRHLEMSLVVGKPGGKLGGLEGRDGRRPCSWRRSRIFSSHTRGRSSGRARRGADGPPPAPGGAVG